MSRFRRIVDRDKHHTRCTLEFTGGRDRATSWGRKEEEYVADFLLTVRRSLSPDDMRIFRYHYLLGADWRLCCMKLKVDKGTLFHECYKIEQHLGRVFREMRPFSLYPVEEYFTVIEGKVEACVPPKRGPKPLRPPLRRPAPGPDLEDKIAA